MTRVRLSEDWDALNVTSPTICHTMKWRIVEHEIIGRNLQSGNRFPSVRELSERYGASRSTVMRAIEELCEEDILETRSRLGIFVVDPSRCQRYQRHSHFVSAIVPPDKPYYQPIIRSIEETLNKRHYFLLVKSLDWTYKEFDACIQEAVEELNVSGLIVSIPKPSRTEAVFNLLESLKIPVVLVDCDHPRFSSVVVDELHGFAEATRHLTGLGHRRIAYLGPSPQEVGQRHAGFVRALSERDLPYLPQRNCVESLDSTKEWSDHPYRLLCDEAITAFVCYNDEYAARLARYFVARGVKIPRDVSIVGYDNLKTLHPGKLPLTSVDPQADEIGRRATSLLINAGRRGGKLEHISLTPKLVLGHSTAAPRRF